MNTPVGSPEFLLGEAVPAADATLLSQKELRPLFDEAVRRWSVELDDPEVVKRLRTVRVEIMDLPGTTLGLASGAVIYLDANAAGHGWFLDSTPWEDSEFALDLVYSPVFGRVDLLTVITHEMGHILGLADDSETDPFTGTVMADSLPLGVRRIHLEGMIPDALSSTILTCAINPACGSSWPHPATIRSVTRSWVTSKLNQSNPEFPVIGYSVGPAQVPDNRSPDLHRVDAPTLAADDLSARLDDRRVHHRPGPVLVESIRDFFTVRRLY
jgi:hypothetical protein